MQTDISIEAELKRQQNLPEITIYTDGGCRGNPGIGGWGVYLRHAQKERRFYGSEANTTNNRMELQAAIEALKALNKACCIQFYTDSQYVKNGVNLWMSNWKKNNWRTANKKPVKNQDLWQQLDALLPLHEIHWHWVKGHAGDEGNEIADQLANQAMDEFLQQQKASR